MSNLADIFTSKTRFEILRILSCQSKFVPLRHISGMIDVPIFSVQRALQQLVAEKIVLKKKKNRYITFSLNSKHHANDLLRQVFDLETKSAIQKRSKLYHNSAKNLLTFCDAAQKLYSKAKKV